MPYIVRIQAGLLQISSKCIDLTPSFWLWIIQAVSEILELAKVLGTSQPQISRWKSSQRANQQDARRLELLLTTLRRAASGSTVDHNSSKAAKN